MTGTSGRARVLFVSSSFPRWRNDSTTPFIFNLASDLRLLGWDVQVLAPHAAGALATELLEGVPVERFRYMLPEAAQTLCYQGGALLNLRRHPSNVAKLPILVLREWQAIAQSLRRQPFDIVHSHWILPQGFTSALATRPRRVPHVATIHGSDIFSLNGSLLNACKRFVLKHADAVTANSSATVQAARDLWPGIRQLVRIPMGASVSAPDAESTRALRSRHQRGKGPVLLFVGRLTEQKGVADLITAVAIARAELPDLTALIVGDGPERARLEAFAKQLEVAEHVNFIGWIDARDLGTYYRAADIFVAPSKQTADGAREAQGLAIIEAMMAGTPVITTRGGGNEDAVRDLETGLLVNQSAPAEIAAKIVQLTRDSALAQGLRANAMDAAQREFTRDASARAFSALYERVLARRVGSAVG